MYRDGSLLMSGTEICCQLHLDGRGAGHLPTYLYHMCLSTPVHVPSSSTRVSLAGENHFIPVLHSASDWLHRQMNMNLQLLCWCTMAPLLLCRWVWISH